MLLTNSLPSSRMPPGTPHHPPGRLRRRVAPSGTPLHIRDLVAEKRRSRSRWQRSRNQGDRAIYNCLKRKLQTALREARNTTFAHFLTSLSPDDSSLWKATKGLKRPQVSIPPVRNSDGSWAKSETRRLRHLRLIFVRCSRRTRLPTLTILWSLTN